MTESRGNRVRSAIALALGAGCSVHGQALSVSQVGGASVQGSYTFVTQPPGDTRDLFVGKQAGQIMRVRDGVNQVPPVLDIGQLVMPGFEAGLLGMAFHPQFQSNGYFYIYYFGISDAARLVGVHVVRYTLDPADPGAVLPGSARDVLYFNHPASDHFGGWLGFGPDGYLYISSGDPSMVAQQTTTFLGKILRIDVDHDDFPVDPVANYAIPPTNPFFGSTSAAPEIWAYGLRNPWRCSFDRLTGDLWVGDVGQSAREEIDMQPAAAPPYAARNYGWPCMEGSLCSGYGGCDCTDPTLTPPVYEYGRELGSTVIGGYVYRGLAIPELRGTYFFADYSLGTIWSFRYGPSGLTDLTDRTAELGSTSRAAFGEGSDGELYFCSFGSTPGNFQGFRIFKIVPACPANCDQSLIEPRLNVNDFICFQSKFAAGDSGANCDGSTTPPILNVNDFLCFQQRFAAGCP